jgi:hypothetical protein
MSNNDLHNQFGLKTAVVNAAIGANATKTGLVIDRQGYGGVEFITTYGAVTTTGTICTLVIKEGDATGSLTSVADTELLGTEALASLLAGARVAGTGKEVSKKIGYIGNKRYVQASVVQTGTTSVGTVGVVAVMVNPSIMPA